MYLRIVSAALAAVFLTGSIATDAFAGHRKRHRVVVYDRFYAGPQYIRAPGIMRLMFGGYGMSREDYEDLYGGEEFDESYYDPQLDDPVPPPKPRKTAKTVTAKPAVPSATKKPLTTASIDKPAKTGTSENTANAAPGSIMPCSKAVEVITGYGFTGVKSSDCDGEIYAFNATRDGKSFAIKLNSASGELTEVKKLQ